MPRELPEEHNPQISRESSTVAPAEGKESLISARFMKWSSLLFFAYFGARLVFFALNISSFVPPDEVTHAGLCSIFAKALLLPANSPESYQFGLVTNTPWLYYWTMGKLLLLNFFGIPDLVFLRLLNIPLAFGTVWYALRLLRLLTDDRLARLLLMVAMTNTAMFSLLSASVSYDNLTNLLAAMSVYYLLAFFKNRSGSLLAGSLLCQQTGSLTKITFLPLVLALSVLLLIHEFKNLRLLPAMVKDGFRRCGIKEWFFALVIIFFIALNLQLYADNYIRYGVLNPSMSDVLSSDISMQYRIGARENIFRMYTEERISYMKALGLTGGIEHPGDKADTFYLLMNYENLKRNPALWMGFPAYAKVWFESMVSTVFGIKAHMPMFKDLPYQIPLYFVMALSLLGFVVRWRPRESGWLPPYLAVIACFYAGYIMYKVNYNAYLYYGTPGITLQGRYLFPVIGPAYVLSCLYLLRLSRSDYLRSALALATALLFIGYDFPWFLAHATPEWFARMPR